MESERRTRKKRIDPLLKGLGWKIVPFNPGRPLGFYENCAIEEYPTDNGPADYALCVHGRIVSVVEAKKLTLGRQSVLTQAQRYSRGLSGSPYNFDGYFVPFLYSTNGEVIWFQDVRHKLSRSRKINQFHTPSALREMLEHNLGAATNWLETHANDHSWLRPYQIEANDAIEKKRSRLQSQTKRSSKRSGAISGVLRLSQLNLPKKNLERSSNLASQSRTPRPPCE